MGGRWGFILLALLLCLGAGCRRQYQGGTVPAMDERPEAYADSLEQTGLPGEFGQPAAGGAGRAAELEDRLNENGRDWSDRLVVPMNGLSVQTIWGARSDIRAKAGLFDGLETGYRTDRIRRTAYITMAGWGPVEFGAAGNVRAAFGEGLVLGSRDPAASPLGSGTRRGDLVVRPSQSLWEQTRGLAAGFRFGRTGTPGLETLLRTGALIWDRYQAADREWQREGWFTISLTWRRWWWGAATGFPAAAGYGAGPTGPSPPRAVTMAVKRALSAGPAGSAGSAGSAAGGRAGLSVEIARMGPDIFLVMGGYGRARQRGRWQCRFFKQPVPPGYGGSANGLIRALKTVSGGSCRLAGRINRLSTSLDLYNGLVRNGAETTHYRRISICLEGRPFGRRHRLKSVLSYYGKRQTRTSLSPLIPESRRSAWTEGRAGLQWDDEPVTFLKHRLRTDCRFDEHFRLVGLLLSVSARFRFRSGEAEWRVTNYAFQSGRSGYVSRPGIGTFEYLSVVYKDGSDLSLRIRLRLGPAFELIGFYGRPWSRRPRYYLGGCLTAANL